MRCDKNPEDVERPYIGEKNPTSFKSTKKKKSMPGLSCIIHYGELKHNIAGQMVIRNPVAHLIGAIKSMTINFHNLTSTELT